MVYSLNPTLISHCRVKGSWQKMFVMLQNNELHFYNDHKTKDSPGAKPLCVFPLMHSATSLYTKEKKKNVFQVGHYSCFKNYDPFQKKKALQGLYLGIQFTGNGRQCSKLALRIYTPEQY